MRVLRFAALEGICRRHRASIDSRFFSGDRWNEPFLDPRSPPSQAGSPQPIDPDTPANPIPANEPMLLELR